MSSQRIFKNTLYLFFRMGLNMIISLLTVRLIFNALGEIDYGIYNVVGGVTLFFSFIGVTLASASQRFFSYEIGMNNDDRLNKIFNLSLLIYLVFFLILFILFESIGLWFISNKINYPIGKQKSVEILFQFSLFTFLINFLTIPFNAIIIAREKMNFYAKISILETFLKLVVAFLIFYYNGDKLVFYSILIFIVSILNLIVYISYCKINFNEVKLKWYCNKKDAKSLVSYSGWNLFGSITSVLNNQGINIIINQFFGPSVNASRAISYQINGSISSISNNIYLAFSPQIVQSYGGNDITKMEELVFKGTKFGFLLLLLVIVPVYFKIDVLLGLWLGNSNVNESMIYFTKLILIYTLVNSFESPITYSVRATGKIKNYQIYVGVFTLLTLPLSYIFFKLGYSAEISVIIMTVIYFAVMFVRLYILKKLIPLFNVKDYLYNIYGKLILLGSIIMLFNYKLNQLLNINDFADLIILSFFNFILTLVFVWFLVLSKSEKNLIIDNLKYKYKFK